MCRSPYRQDTCQVPSFPFLSYQIVDTTQLFPLPPQPSMLYRAPLCQEIFRILTSNNIHITYKKILVEPT